MEKTKPKFKVGQIVVLMSIRSQPSFRIKEVIWEDGWFYKYNRNNAVSESMLRELTLEEKGNVKIKELEGGIG